MADQNIDIAIRAKNQASAALKQVKADMQGLDSAAKTVGGGFGGIAGAIGVGAVFAGVGQITQAVTDMVATADRVGKLRASFEGLAQSAGQSAGQMLSAMRAASNGMIADSDLMLSANKAMLLGVADSADELTALLQVAQSRGAAMGLNVTQAFNDIVTGLGRESALILDNLGITVDLTKVMDDYARSLGTTAAQLDGAQRKQALLNEVMRQSRGMTAAVPTGAAAAAAQSKAAQEQAAVTVGEFFAPAVRDSYQGMADAINLTRGEWNSLDVAIRETSDLLADVELPPTVITRLQEYVSVAQQVRAAQEAGVEGAGLWARMLDEMAARAMSGTLNVGDVAKINQVSAALTRTREALDEQAQAQARATEQANRASPYYQQIVQRENEMAQAAFRADPAILQLANSLGIVGAMALSASSDLNTFNAAVNRIQGGFAAADRVQGVRMAAISAAEANAQRAVEAGADPQQVAAQLANVTDQIWNMAGPTEQTTESMFLFKQETTGAGAELDNLASGLEDANRAATKAASGGIKALNQEYENLKSKISGVLAAQLDVGVGVKAADLLPREDEINENARRLAAIAVEGLTDQSWLEEFKAEVPQVWAELQKTMEEGGDVKQTAARILKDFEDGLRPDMLDRGLAKERIKRMILGEQSMAALAEELAQELSAEMGIPLEKALAAAGASLGVTSGAAGEAAAGTATSAAPDMTSAGTSAGATFAAGFATSVNGETLVTGVVASMNTADLTPLNNSGASAGTQWGAGFVENASGALLVASIVAKIAADLPKFKDSGASAGTQWGAGFMGTVETGIARPLINLLTVLVTPGVMAAIQAGNSQTTPP